MPSPPYGVWYADLTYATVTVSGIPTELGTLVSGITPTGPQFSNTFYAAPSNVSGTPTFRYIEAGDLVSGLASAPSIGTTAAVTSGVFVNLSATSGSFNLISGILHQGASGIYSLVSGASGALTSIYGQNLNYVVGTITSGSGQTTTYTSGVFGSISASSGTITNLSVSGLSASGIVYPAQASGEFLASPASGSGVPAFRAIQFSDIASFVEVSGGPASSGVASYSNLLLVSGNLSTVSGNLSTVSGNLNLVSGNLSTVSGNLNLVSGNLSTVSGNLNLVSGNLNLVSGVAGAAMPNASGSLQSLMTAWILALPTTPSTGASSGWWNNSGMPTYS